MKLCEIKDFACVQLRNKDLYIKFGNYLIWFGGSACYMYRPFGWMSLSTYDNDTLKHTVQYKDSHFYDIVRVNNNVKAESGKPMYAVARALEGVWTWEGESDETE